MSILTSDPTTPVNDQQLRAVARAVLHTVTMSAQKAALNHADPKRFPIKKGVSSIENTIAPLFKELPPERQEAVKSQALASPGAPDAHGAAAAPESAGVDFASAVPVSDQLHADAARVKTQLARAPRIVTDDGDWPRIGDGDRWPPKNGDGDGSNGGGTLPLKRAVLSLHSIKAVKDTKDFGKDEIYLGATAVGVTTAGGKPVTSKEMVVDAFNLGSFKKGQTKSLGDKVLYAFYPPKPEQYPAGYAVTLLLLEKDWGKRETIRKVLKNIEDAVAKEIARWAKEFDGLLGKLAELVMKLLPPLLAKVFDLIAGWLGDDLFDPATITLSITSPDSRLPGSNFTPRQTVPLLMKGGKNGRYELTYSWHVFA